MEGRPGQGNGWLRTPEVAEPLPPMRIGPVESERARRTFPAAGVSSAEERLVPLSPTVQPKERLRKAGICSDARRNM